MADTPPVRSNIQLPGVQFRAAISELFAQNMGATMNFLNYFQHSEKQFFANGRYSLAALPFLGLDGMCVVEFNMQIIDVWAFNRWGGTSGTTQFDLNVITAPGATPTSIFTTKPAIAYNAHSSPGIEAPVWVGAVNPTLIGSQYNPSPPYSPPANTTQPVLNASVTNLIPAWSALRADITQAQVDGRNGGLLVHYRPV